MSTNLLSAVFPDINLLSAICAVVLGLTILFFLNKLTSLLVLHSPNFGRSIESILGERGVKLVLVFFGVGMVLLGLSAILSGTYLVQ